MPAWLADPKTMAQVVLRPTERQSVESIRATRHHLVVALYENVRGSVRVYQPGDWSYSTLALPQNVSVGVGSASEKDDKVFVSVRPARRPEARR